MTTPLIEGLGSAPAPAVQAGYGVSLNDVAHFERAIERAHSAAAQGFAAAPVTVAPSHLAQAPGAAMEALFRPLDQINGQAAQLSAQAQTALDEGRALSPSEMVLLTMKAHEFMFHCQLTSNVANRTSDGLQQLFRQQA